VTYNRPALCGTLGGAQRHRRAGETSCEACRQAVRDRDRAWNLRRNSGYRLSTAEAYARLGLPRDRTAMAGAS